MITNYKAILKNKYDTEINIYQFAFRRAKEEGGKKKILILTGNAFKNKSLPNLRPISLAYK